MAQKSLNILCLLSGCRVSALPCVIDDARADPDTAIIIANAAACFGPGGPDPAEPAPPAAARRRQEGAVGRTAARSWHGEKRPRTASG